MGKVHNRVLTPGDVTLHSVKGEEKHNHRKMCSPERI